MQALTRTTQSVPPTPPEHTPASLQTESDSLGGLLDLTSSEEWREEHTIRRGKRGYKRAVREESEESPPEKGVSKHTKRIAILLDKPPSPKVSVRKAHFFKTPAERDSQRGKG